MFTTEVHSAVNTIWIANILFIEILGFQPIVTLFGWSLKLEWNNDWIFLSRIET